MKYLTFALLLFASPALAQQTECRQFGNVTRCSQTELTKPMDFLGAMGGAGPSYNDQVLQERQIEALRRQEDASLLRQRVGALIAKNQCDAAVTLALKGGDIDLAERAKAYCSKPN